MTLNAGGWYLNPPFTLRTLTPLSVVKTLGGGVGLVTNPPLVLTMLQWSSFDVLTLWHLVTSPSKLRRRPLPFFERWTFSETPLRGFHFLKHGPHVRSPFGANLLQTHVFHLFPLFFRIFVTWTHFNHVWRSREWDLSREQVVSYWGPGLDEPVGKSGGFFSSI